MHILVHSTDNNRRIPYITNYNVLSISRCAQVTIYIEIHFNRKLITIVNSNVNNVVISGISRILQKKNLVKKIFPGCVIPRNKHQS